MVNCLVFSNCYIRHCKNWYLQYFCLIKKRKMLEIIIIIIIVFLKLWHCQIIWYLFACFKVIILGSFHSIWFVKYVFSAKLRFVKPSTRLMKYESRVLKSNPELVNNSIVDHLEQCGLFSVFHNGFRSSQSTADLLKVVSDRIARAFNRSGATQAVALDISKAFDKVWHAGLLHKLKSYGISGLILGLISSFLSNRWLWVVLDGKFSQKYPVNAGAPQGSILGPTLLLLCIN